MSLILRNTQAVLDVVVSAGDATGTVTATVKDENGTTVSSGNASLVAPSTGHYQFTLAPQAALKRITTFWTGVWNGVSQTVETYDEVIGGHLFTIAQARTFNHGQMASTTDYPDDDIREARDRIFDAFQVCCGVPFFPRYEREVLDGTGRRRVWLPHKRPLAMISATVDGVALTGPELAAVQLYVTGRIERDAMWSKGLQNVVVEWERGYRRPPLEITRAARALATYEVVSSEITDRMVSVANELGTVRLSIPGRNHPTGIPLIDAALYRYDERDTNFVAIRTGG